MDQVYTSEVAPFPPQSKEQWIGGHHMFLAGFPDMQETFEVLCVEGNTVRGINHTTATHTGDFDLSPMGIGIISVTGKSVFTVHSVMHVVENGKIVSTTGKSVANCGCKESLSPFLIIRRQGSPFQRFAYF